MTIKYEYELPKLLYAYDALEPYFDAKTMELHHSKHHQTYITKLLEFFHGKHPEEDLKTLLLSNPAPAVQNHGGGHYNHSLLWKMMKPHGGGKPTHELGQAIDKWWGSYEAFQKEFTDKALGLFGSGWTWLVRCKNGDLKIIQKPNQNHPDIGECEPVLGIDVWEHAYYLKYQNRRAEYVTAFWHVINWEFCQEQFLKKEHCGCHKGCH